MRTGLDDCQAACGVRLRAGTRRAPVEPVRVTFRARMPASPWHVGEKAVHTDRLERAGVERGWRAKEPPGQSKSDYATLMVEILGDNARPEAEAVYGAIDMAWAKLVGQIAQAYGK